MKPKPEGEARERTRRDGGRMERHVLAIGKRVKNRWLIEMSLAAPRIAPPLRMETTAAHAA
jgi:hypothetical protein